MFEYKDFEIASEGKDSLRFVDNEFAVAVDPSSSFPDDFEPAIILITSEDPKKLDNAAIQNFCGRGTCIVLPESLEGQDVPCPDTEYLRPGEAVDIYNVEIECLESSEGLAYRFKMQDTAFFVSGDTCDIKNPIEFEKSVDVAFFSVDEDIDLDNVVKKAVRIKPNVLVPYNYSNSRSLEGFKAEVEDRNIQCRVEDRP